MHTIYSPFTEDYYISILSYPILSYILHPASYIQHPTYVIRLLRCVVERRVTGTCYCLLSLKSQSYKVAIYKQLSSKFEKSQHYKIIS